MRAPWLIILLVTIALFTGLASACGGGGDDDDDDGDPTRTEAGETPEETEDDEPVGAADLAHAVVQIFALGSDGDPAWWGSGTIISKDGMILTNAHVVDDRFDEYESLGIGLTDQADEPPEIGYAAEIRAVDYALDLAVIEITEEIDGGAVLEDFPFVELGDSDTVDIGDDVQILGYPSIGGATITFTRGSVSGFTSERLVGSRAWIKTDATIAGGNSGGLAVNEDGVIIGVPTVVGSGSQEDYVDCRVLEDTNADGYLDDADDCVTVGGFINGLRPVNLALDLIEAAEAGDEYVSPYFEEEDIEETPVGGFDTENIFFTDIVFSPDVTDDDEPTDVVLSLPSLTPRACAFWDYTGMQDGLSWDALWYIDGELFEAGSILADTWGGGESGNWWVCTSDENGLIDGLWEVLFQVENEVIASRAIYIGDDHEVVDFEIENESSVEVCAVAVSPNGAQNWGGDVLGAGVTLPPGTSHTIEVATGIYDLLAVDCDGETLLEDYEIPVGDNTVFTISDI